MTSLSSIKRLFHVIDKSLFMTTGKLDYARITEATIALANAVHEYSGENDDLWNIGEHGRGLQSGACCLSDYIVGAYWHYTEWHAGMSSNSYAALCALGLVFNPGMTSVESDNEAYIALHVLAGESS